MTLRLPSICAALALSSLAAGQVLQPDAGQKALIERGYGMFIHFGVNTFNQIEWSDGKLPASSFNPTQLDAEQWVRVAKSFDAKHLIFIAKHHNGFCNWPTTTTNSSPSTTCSRVCASGAVSWPPPCRAASVKCWQSGAR